MLHFGPGCVRAELLSSADSKSSNLVQCPSDASALCFVTFFISQSMITMIKKADIAHDWRTSEFTTSFKLQLCMPRLTLLLNWLIMLVNFAGIP